MSIIVTGSFILTELNEAQLIDLSFNIQKLALSYRLGISLGANVTGYTVSRAQSNYLDFQLSDDPLDDKSEYLFSGDGIKIKVGDFEEPRSERLKIRMSRLYNFFESVFSTELVEKIILNIDLDKNEKINVINIRVDEFISTILSLFKMNDNWTPSLQIIINQSN